MTRCTRLYENKTVADLVTELAGRVGLQPVVNGLSQDVGVQVQMNESDLAFVRRILRRFDGDMQVVGSELHAAPRADLRRGELHLALHSQLRRVRLLADLAHQVTAVTVTGWDAGQGQRVSSTANGANLGPGQGRSGAQLLQQALGERSEHIGHLSAGLQTEADAMSAAAFDQRARRLVTVDATAEGNPALRVGAHVTLSGLGRRFDNIYYVTRAVHRFDMTNGYQTDFEAECAYFGGA
jgi:phage protein D